MVKFIISTRSGETSKYTHEFNTYDVREEFLYPIEMNDIPGPDGGPQPDVNLATYLINVTEFKKPNVEIEKDGTKAGFLQ